MQVGKETIDKLVQRIVDAAHPHRIILYPGPVEPVTEAEYREAIRLAEASVRWAEGIICE